MGEELLSWLLPEAAAPEQAVARRVITALRLLRDDARLREARRVAPAWARARTELEHQTRRRRRRALEGLLHHYLAEFRAPDSFLELGTEAGDYAAAWRELLDAPGAALPAPSERPQAVVARLIAAGAGEGAPPGWREIWEARARHVFAETVEAERGWLRAFTAALEARARPLLLARLLGGLVAARLDRFRPVEAFELYPRFAPLVGLDPSLRRLLGWSALFAGEHERARELLRGACAVPLPCPVAELREDLSGWAEFLPGAARTPAVAPCERPGTRKDLGAVVLAVFACSAGRAELVRLDASRSLRAAARKRAAGLAIPAELLEGRAAVRGRRVSGSEPRDLLGGSRTKAFARVAVRGVRGAFLGWIQLESAHDLLPSEAELARLARGARALLLERAGAAARSAPHAFSTRARALEPDDPRRAFLATLSPLLGSLVHRRALWIEPDVGGQLEVIAERGGALGDWRARGGGGGLLRRAVAERAVVWHSGEQEAALHRGARAGVAVPLCAGGNGRLLGLLALESSSRDPEPFEPAALQALGAALASRELAWWCAAFRAHVRRRSGLELAWAPESRFLAELEPRVAAAAAGGTALAIIAPDGAGRRTLASWLDFRDVRSSELAEALPLRVPPLAERRDELPALALALARNAARRAGLRSVHLWDEALAALWRQDWPGNVVELAEVLGALVRAHPGAELGAAEVRAAFAQRGVVFRERLPSRRANAPDLECALAVTRHLNGSVNRARAARYLGWASETLAARLQDRSREPAD